jgi:hypothetical protein
MALPGSGQGAVLRAAGQVGYGLSEVERIVIDATTPSETAEELDEEATA